MSAMELIRNTLADGEEHLGDLIWWTLADVRIDREQLVALWTEAGLEASLLPEEPSAERALKLAAREAQLGQRNRLVRLGKEDAAEIVFAVVREDRDVEGNLSFAQEARVILDRQHGRLSAEPLDHDLALSIQTSFELLRTTHTSDDVRRSIVRSLRAWSAVTLRDGGGVYWVPATFASRLRQLQQAIGRVGASRVHLLPVHRSVDAEQTLGELARGSIEAELTALKAEISAFLESPPDRPSTLVRRFDVLETLRARGALYKSVLAIEVEDLDRQLDDLAATVEHLLGEKNAAVAA